VLREGDLRIRDLLVSAGVLSEQDADRAMDLASPKEGPGLVDILISRRMAEERAILEALAKEAGWAVGSEDAEPTPEALAVVGKDLAREYGVLPLSIQEGVLVIAVSERTTPSQLDDLHMLANLELKPVLALERRIQPAINDAYESVQTSGKKDIALEDALADLETESWLEPKDLETPVYVKVVDDLITEAVDRGASHVHLDPGEGHIRVRLRIEGAVESKTVPVENPNGVVARLKIMAEMDISERRRPLDGRIRWGTAPEEYEILCATLPVDRGERVVLTFRRTEARTRSLEEMGAPSDVVAQVRSALASGLTLVCSNEAHRRSELLRAAAAEADLDERIVLAVSWEGCGPFPEGISRVNTDSAKGFHLAGGIHGATRQDPDLVIVEEIRDRETADVTLTMAGRGVAMLAPMHVAAPEDAIQRLNDMGLEPDAIAQSLELVLAQYPIRRLCSECRRRCAADASPFPVAYEPVGCPSCVRGFRGEVYLYRMLRMDPELRDAIRGGKTPKQAPSLREIAAPLVESGTISPFDVTTE
jgi:type IV pilus assembly protein PilB